MEITTIGIDLAKDVFAVCGAAADGKIVLRKTLRRHQVLGFFGQQRPCVVAMEACGGAHWWTRKFAAQGHTVKLLNPRAVTGVDPVSWRVLGKRAEGGARCRKHAHHTRPSIGGGWLSRYEP
ncbi:MAG: hypothetical protein ACLQDV_20760, partial [Candidatus Binataceae bacterium]